jgi:diguanylate cyclase (GGDEF)-like protein
MNLQDALTALALAVKQLREAALTDTLTPLGNSLALSEVESTVGAGEDNPDVVVFGDLNRFKSLNDRFGHATGDAAIRRVGELIEELIVRGCQAQAFRRSGDEFVILLSRRSLESFESIARSFAACEFRFNDEVRRTAMSFGYAVSQGEVSFADLLSKAEIACQVAKSLGDGVCLEWSEEVERATVDNLRDRCANCGADIRCNVPRREAQPSRKLKRCPFCEEPLTGGRASVEEA